MQSIFKFNCICMINSLACSVNHLLMYKTVPYNLSEYSLSELKKLFSGITFTTLNLT